MGKVYMQCIALMVVEQVGYWWCRWWALQLLACGQIAPNSVPVAQLLPLLIVIYRVAGGKVLVGYQGAVTHTAVFVGFLGRGRRW